MARTVYRSLSSKRRTAVPRPPSPSSTGAGMTTGFGRMLAKLMLASDTLQASRRRPYR